MKRLLLGTLVLAGLASINAFSLPNFARGAAYSAPIEPSSRLFSSESWYGEESRKYRRTVYSHDDWVKHRSPDRYIRNIVKTTSSGIYKNVGREVTVVVGIAITVMLWNMATVGYTDISGNEHGAIWSYTYTPPFKMPSQIFTLPSSFLGLLLVFRTNKAYKRWDEARKNWGMNINHTRDLVRMANTFYEREGVSDERRREDLERVSLCTWAFVRAMQRHLSQEAEDEVPFQQEMFARLDQDQARSIIRAAHRPNRALHDLSMAIENLPMNFFRKNEIQKAVTIFEDNLGSSERLLTSPVPIFYNRHLSRFLALWLFTLPLALWEPFAGTWNHIGMIPASAMLSVFLFGIDELATQMEEPFTILPMQAFSDKIFNWCNEIVSWEDGDNGIYTRKPHPGHQSFFFELEEGASPTQETKG